VASKGREVGLYDSMWNSSGAFRFLRMAWQIRSKVKELYGQERGEHCIERDSYCVYAFVL
jgi:hypothetical protein